MLTHWTPEKDLCGEDGEREEAQQVTVLVKQERQVKQVKGCTGDQ